MLQKKALNKSKMDLFRASLSSESDNLMQESARPIVHCCYHKCMTVYFMKIMQRLAQDFQLPFQYVGNTDPVDPQARLLLFPHSCFDSDLMISLHGDYIGTHLIRDPRDILVSAYFYHLRTTEEWCAKPNPAHVVLPPDVSYQYHLQNLSMEDGFLFEMGHVTGHEIRQMAECDYDNPRFLECRFENILANETESFRKIFDWYGFTGERHASAVAIAESLALQNSTQQDATERHDRQRSRIGQWQDYFTEPLKSEFKRRFGNILIKLGYAADDRW